MKRLFKVFLFAAGILSLMAVLFWIHRVYLQHELASYRRQLQSQGERVTEQELCTPFSRIDPQTGSNLVFACKSLVEIDSIFDSPRVLNVRTNNHTLALSGLPEFETPEWIIPWTILAQAMETNEATLKEIRRLVQTTNSIYYVNWRSMVPDSTNELPFFRAVPALQTSVLLELHNRNFSQAQEDFLTALRLIQYKPQPPVLEFILPSWGRYSEPAFLACWELLQYDVWTDAQLQELQNAWQSMELLRTLLDGFEFNRVLYPSKIEYARHYWPIRCLCDEMEHYDSAGYVWGKIKEEFSSSPRQAFDTFWLRFPNYWDWILRRSYRTERNSLEVQLLWMNALRDVQAGQPFVSLLKEADIQQDRILRQRMFRSDFDFEHNFGSEMRFSLAHGIATETMRRLMVTAIALKRFYLQNGHYPIHLAELTPTYLASVPMDPMDGKPLRYSLEGGDKFRLYSVGVDGKDDGGLPARKPFQIMFPSFDQISGSDMTWPEPATYDEVLRWYSPKGK